MENTTIPIEHGMLLDIDKCSSRRAVLTLHAGDRTAHELIITLASSGEKLSLPDNASVAFCARRADGTGILSSCTVNPDGTVSHLFTSSESAVAGDMECELYIVTSDAELTSPKFIVTVEGIVRNGDSVEADNDFSLLGELIESAGSINVEMDGKALIFTDKNGDTSTLSFSEKADGKVTVTFTDKDSRTSSFEISDGAAGAGNDGATMVRSDSTGELAAVGEKIYLLDEDNDTTLEKTCEAVYHDSAEHLVFVKHNGRYYAAQDSKYGSKLRIIYDFFDSADTENFKKITIVWNSADNTVTKQSRMMYATDRLWYDEEYYYTCPPTVEAIEAVMYKKPAGGIPASDLAAGVIPTVPTAVSAFTNDSGYLTLSTLPIYDGSVT